MDTIKAVIMGLGIILAIMFFGAFLFLAEGALSGQEQYECQKWQIEAEQYEGYYLAQWQKAQCDHYSITIDAPVK